MSSEIVPQQTQIFEYLNEEGLPVIKIDFYDGDMWASAAKMGELFGVNRTTIEEHIQNIYDTQELEEAKTQINRPETRTEGNRTVKRNINSYSLDMIIAVGYRVNTKVGTRFRKWATAHLNELVTKGYTLDEKRLNDPKDKALDELLNRVRAIRSSERHLADKVKDIFTTSIDYEPGSQLANLFFAAVNNKFHFAIHGHTATEVVTERIDSSHERLGLVTYRGKSITKQDALVAKNYLDEKELKKLELLVEGFLSYAELRTVEGKTMTMQGWKDWLDRYLKFNDMEVLQGAGKVSRPEMERVVEQEYGKFNRRVLTEKAPPGKVVAARGKKYVDVIGYGND